MALSHSIFPERRQLVSNGGVRSQGLEVGWTQSHRRSGDGSFPTWCSGRAPIHNQQLLYLTNAFSTQYYNITQYITSIKVKKYTNLIGLQFTSQIYEQPPTSPHVPPGHPPPPKENHSNFCKCKIHSCRGRSVHP